jgi:hypothetical protein
MAPVDAPKYTWVCQYCGRSSPGGTLSCVGCGFPAHTTAHELERVKQLGSVTAFLAERQAQRDNWRRKPLPRKVLFIIAVPLSLVGIVLLQFTWGWKSMELGAAMAGASLLCIWLGR